MRLIATGDGAPPTIDEAEVARALGVLVAPGDAFEVRALPSRWAGFFLGGEDPGPALGFIRSVGDGFGVYYTLNPVSPELAAGAAGNPKVFATNAGVTHRRWLLVDVDYSCKGHKGGTSAEEKALALEVMDGIKAELHEEWGWPAPVTIDSGNGYHCLYRIDLPNDEESLELVGGVLRALESRHNRDGAKVDQTVKNAARIAGLPGTWNRKGENTPDRPWRMRRLLHVPDPIGVVTAEQLAEVADSAPKPERPALAPLQLPASAPGSSNVEAYALSVLEGELRAAASALPGERHEMLFKAAARCGDYIHTQAFTYNEAFSGLMEAARQCGLDQDPGEDVEKTIRDGLAKGMSNPQEVPDRPLAPQPRLKLDAPIAPERIVSSAPLRIEGVDPGEDPTIPTDLIDPKEVKWLYPGRIASGMLTLFAGAGSQGKSTVAYDLAARITNGEEWPEAQGECAEVGNVLLVNSEDSAAHIIVPRLIAAGANRSRCRVLKTQYRDRFTLTDVVTLDSAFCWMQGVSMVVIDPAPAYLGKANENSNSEVQQSLRMLHAWAEQRDVAVVLVTHINKGPASGKASAVSRIMGSAAWVNSVRQAHIFVADPDDHRASIWIPVKSNIAAKPNALHYRIVDSPAGAKVDWLGLSDLSADEAMEGEKKPRGEAAAEWLKQYLSKDGGRPAHAKQVIEDGKKAGFGRDSVYKAADSLGLKREKRAGVAGAIWYWSLTQTDEPDF